MKTLVEIRDLVIKDRDFAPELDKFTQFINEGNELEAWQIALGYHAWLIHKKIITTEDVVFIEEMANGIGKIWYESGQLRESYTYKDGKLEGLYQSWHSNGKLCESYTYKNHSKAGI